MTNIISVKELTNQNKKIGIWNNKMFRLRPLAMVRSVCSVRNIVQGLRPAHFFGSVAIRTVWLSYMDTSAQDARLQGHSPVMHGQFESCDCNRW